MIDTNLNIQFTGVTTEKHHKTLIDGEHIVHNKTKQFYNLYAAFDIYYLDGKDIRALPFINEENRCRYNELKTELKDLLTSENQKIFQLSIKTFYKNDRIFDSCKIILELFNTLSRFSTLHPSLTNSSSDIPK